MQLPQLFSKINTFVFDVDGVMTDGSLIIMPNGEFIRTMDIKDGYAIQLAIKKGYQVLVITGSSSNPVAERLAYLGVKEFHQKVGNKKDCLQALMQKYQLQYDTILYMGDDMPDLVAMQEVAIASCPADAAIDILKMAHYISPKNGGKGCVRDVIEKVMKLQGKWEETTAIQSI
jgi:3-deoxy-D-manno-octulosonate 8-phosphate phosphatase (KDO 8-P phosphatase)